MAVAGLQRLARLRLNARRPDVLAAFFIQALGFQREGASGARVALTLNASRIEIAACEGADYPASVPGWSPLFQHFAIVVADMAAAVERLAAAPGWTAITDGGPQRLPASSGGVVAFKFRDPEGHPLELLEAPGAPPAAPTQIDHSAISVADTNESVAFYRSLGLAVGSRSLNRGPEQERLDGLADVRVDVTALLLPRAGPHVELLGYRGDYRRPAAASLEDVAATRMVLTTATHADLDAVRSAFQHHLVADEADLLLRDPDGHLLQIEAEA
jgi:catechol 2,3-dioxygenase-like lactoylglutathione lyase family enzyme